MFYFLSKIFNKIWQICSRWLRGIRKLYLGKLYKGRFIYGKKFSIKSTSRIAFDITESVIQFGNGVQVRDHCFFRCEQDGRLFIGNNVFFNNGCSVSCMSMIIVGNDCQFGEGVKLYDHNHVYTDKDQLVAHQGYTKGDITIGNNCWIGSNVIILKGVTIGDNVVIGAGCIIYKPVLSGSVIVNHQNLVIQS